MGTKIQDLVFLYKQVNIGENLKKAETKEVHNLAILQIYFKSMIFKSKTNKNLLISYFTLKSQ